MFIFVRIEIVGCWQTYDEHNIITKVKKSHTHNTHCLVSCANKFLLSKNVLLFEGVKLLFALNITSVSVKYASNSFKINLNDNGTRTKTFIRSQAEIMQKPNQD